jgi:phospholipid-transporting ATPase
MQRHWYLRMGEGKESNIERLLFDRSNRAVVGLLDFLTLFILYSSLIPISLYVSIEIIKFFQVGSLSSRPQRP